MDNQLGEPDVEMLGHKIVNSEFISHVPLLIEELAENITTKSSRIKFYLSILAEIEDLKSYRSYIIRNPEKTSICAEIDGTLLYRNKDASEWEPLAIIGSSPKRVPLILTELVELFAGKNRAQRRISFEKYYEGLIKDENTEVIIRRPYINLSKYSSFEFNFYVGDSVKKGYSVGDLEHMQFSEKAQRISARYIMAFEHITVKLHELNKDQPAPENLLDKKEKINKARKMKEQNLLDIWAGDKRDKYDLVIDAILKIKLDNDKGIVSRNGKVLEWSPLPAKGSQMYLAAFFYECEKANLLDVKKYEGRVPVILEILKRTFSIECSDDAFHALKNDALDYYMEYRKEFRKIIKRITQ